MAEGQKEIMVRVGADIEPLKKGFKTAGEKVKAFGNDSVDAAKKVAGLTAAVAASAAALVAMANASAEDAREIANLSRLVGTSTDKFQKLSFAAKSVGIEQEKLADIYKDTQDKVGDFLQTGGGPLVDYFENIAPLVGQTAAEFRNLSGPDALQKYTNGLQAANLSQSEMTFFLEGIASDAALLEPLLRDNGAAFEALGEKAGTVGAVLSGLDIARLDQMKTTLDQIQASAKVTTDRFSAQLAPVIGALADKFLEVRGESSLLQDSFENTFDFLVNAIGFSLDAIRGLHVVVKGLELGFNALGVGIFAILEVIPKTVDIVINSAKSKINELIDGMNHLPGIDFSRLTIGVSAATQVMTDFRISAVAEFQETKRELDELAMRPMPSTMWDQFVADAQASSTEAAQAVVTARQNAIEVLEGMNDGHYAKDVADAKEAAKAKEKVQSIFDSKSISAISNTFGTIASMQNTETKKGFENSKKAAAAQTIVDTYASAQAAFKSLAGIPVVGPALGAAAAGVAIAGGLSRLSSISSTTFGSNSISQGGGGSISSAPSVSSTAGQAGSAAEGGGTLFVEGISPDQLYSDQHMRSLASRLIDVQKDGVEVVLT